MPKCNVVSHCVTCALGLAWMAAPARACPMCRDSAAVDPTAAPAEAAALDFNTSVYVMLGVVAVVGGTVGRAMVKAVRG